MGLKGLHALNVVHLDIKPDNIFVKGGTFKIGDLGHACLAQMQTSPVSKPASSSMDIDEYFEHEEYLSSSCGMQVDEGDAKYMARELLEDEYGALPKADIFSLGASAYEMCLGRDLPPNGAEWASIREGAR